MIFSITIDLNDVQVSKMEKHLGYPLSLSDVQQIVERACDEWVNEQTPDPYLISPQYNTQLISFNNQV